MLLLSNHDVEQVLGMKDCIAVVEEGLRDLGSGQALDTGRSDVYTSTTQEGLFHRLAVLRGTNKRARVMSVRLMSDMTSWTEKQTEDKYCTKPGLFCGLIMLFSTETGEPLAIMHDGVLQHLSVGAGAGVGAGIIAHENVLNRMSAPTGKTSPFPTTAWPTDTFIGRQKELYFNNESIQTIYKPGHTDADSIVYFRKSDVIVAGELFNTLTYPVIDLARGGSVKGVLNGLNDMLDIAIPKAMQEGGTYIIPGRGRLTDEADLLEYRDMVTILRDRVQDAVKRGLTLDQVKAAKFTLDYDARWGATSGPWTTDMFIEALYKDLSKAGEAPKAAPAKAPAAPAKKK
jgi:glyoxylase-like metal-dependent hydrolase (beta-lactamase superfamily II)